MSEITTKINKTVKKFNMLKEGDYVVVGVSGGADSMFLLNYLCSVKDELNLRLLVANVEHGIRGLESLKDSKFVENYCKEKGIEFESLSINAPALAKAAGMGVEEYSRKRRYEFFSSFNADKIATAHNLSDNVETVLFRLSRGTALKGCCGIPPVRDNIIRPLIELSSSEIREECKRLFISFVSDSTNSDNAYSRNYIRNVVIPDFEKLNPSFEKTIMRFIESANEDNDFLEQEAEKCFSECDTENGLLLSKLRSYSPSIIKRAIVFMFEKYNIALDDFHLNKAYELVFKSGKYQIKNSIYAVSNKTHIRAAEFNESNNEFFIKKSIIGIDEFLNKCELSEKEFDFCCDCDRIIGNLIIRQRQEGDRISPSGRGCTKSLKKLFNEYKIPIEKRSSVPVVADDGGVIGIIGYCHDERVKIDKKTKRVVLINTTEDKF